MQQTEQPSGDKKDRPAGSAINSFEGLIFVKDQSGRGRGLKTTREFKRDERVALYSSNRKKIDKPSEKDWRYMLASKDDNYAYTYGEKSGPAIFINDACSPETITNLTKCL